MSSEPITTPTGQWVAVIGARLVSHDQRRCIGGLAQLTAELRYVFPGGTTQTVLVRGTRQTGHTTWVVVDPEVLVDPESALPGDVKHAIVKWLTDHPLPITPSDVAPDNAPGTGTVRAWAAFWKLADDIGDLSTDIREAVLATVGRAGW